MVPVIILTMVIMVMIVVVPVGHDDHLLGFGRGSGEPDEADDGEQQNEQCFHMWVMDTDF